MILQRYLELCSEKGVAPSTVATILGYGKSAFTRWKDIAASNNGIDNMTPYELRHTYVSLNKDMPEDLLKLQVGHSKAMPTREQYSHERAGDSERAAELSGIALKKVLKKRGK